MDGARFANALAFVGCTPAELSWKAGVDVLSLGATKNGAMARRSGGLLQCRARPRVRVPPQARRPSAVEDAVPVGAARRLPDRWAVARQRPPCQCDGAPPGGRADGRSRARSFSIPSTPTRSSSSCRRTCTMRWRRAGRSIILGRRIARANVRSGWSRHSTPIQRTSTASFPSPRQRERSMTHQRTLTAAHWGVYEVEYDDKGQAAKLHPFSKDPDPSPIGLHMLSDEVARLRVRRPAFRKSWLEKGPGAEYRQARTGAVHRAAVGRGARSRRRRAEAREGRALQPRHLRRLLRLVERRPLPSCAEPGPSLPERDRRLRAPRGFLQPGRGARADAAHRGQHGRPDGDAHDVGRAGRALQAVRHLRRRTAQERADQCRRRDGASAQGRPLRHARQGRALRQHHADRRGPRHRRRYRMAGDPAQHRCRDDPGALPRSLHRESLRPRIPRPLHGRLRQVRALAGRQDAGMGRGDHRHQRPPHPRAGARDGGDPHDGEHQLVAAALASRRAAVLGAGDPGQHAGPDRPAGRRLRRELRPDQHHGRQQPAVFRADAVAGHQPGARLHPGRALHRHAAQSGRPRSRTTGRRSPIPTSG